MTSALVAMSITSTITEPVTAGSLLPPAAPPRATEETDGIRLCSLSALAGSWGTSGFSEPSALTCRAPPESTWVIVPTVVPESM